ncbi:MAG: RnfABCDGE type electron transport complex subunit D [Tannerellaceae bacterium]|jgi:electron transport complex protein RnfD|nr:RnfABCDGE type electron transport complex subunit D [Tannerellaceae bacterium]
MENKLIISPSPHIHGGDSVEKNMRGVIVALIPAFLVSIYYFGLGALIVTAVSVVSCVLVEYMVQRFLLKKASSIGDGSAILTGVLLAFNLPSNLPAWIVVIGAVAAIGIGKMSFGGLGNNIFNPALVGRVFLLISFPAQMTTWPLPGAFPLEYTDGLTGATALSVINAGGSGLPSFSDMATGKMGGSLGEVSAAALLLGFAYLLWRKVVSWHIPLAVIASVFAFTGIAYLVDPVSYASPAVHILSGGLLLGAFFMATDFVTSPMSYSGMIVFGVGIGLITSVIRLFGAYPEGVSFAILIMNAVTPLINTYFKPQHFGGKTWKS